MDRRDSSGTVHNYESVLSCRQGEKAVSHPSIEVVSARFHPIARSLCNIETIIGQLYPATLLARLVTLELAGRK